MKALLYVVHAAELPVPSYFAALKRRGVEAEVHAMIAPGLPNVPGGGLSARYDAFAGKHSALGALLAFEPPAQPLQDYDAFFVACWSSGYGWARHLSPGDRGLLNGLFLIDSGHTSLDPDNTASDAGVQWAVDIAKDARRGKLLFWIGHTDVPTGSYGQKGAYASTTKFAAEVVKLAGGAAGLFHVRSYDLRKGDHAGEHRDSLNVWGPEFVAEGIATMKADKSEAKPETLGGQLATWAESELSKGVAESPLGSNDGTSIREYFGVPKFTRDDPRTVEVDNKPIKVGKTEWCAAMACFGLWVLTEGKPPFDGYEPRVSGIELENDAKRVGRFIPRGHGKGRRGDIAIFRRSVKNNDPADDWKRHVAIVVQWGDSDMFDTVGGNENHRVKLTHRDAKNPDFLGVIRIDAD